MHCLCSCFNEVVWHWAWRCRSTPSETMQCYSRLHVSKIYSINWYELSSLELELEKCLLTRNNVINDTYRMFYVGRPLQRRWAHCWRKSHPNILQCMNRHSQPWYASNLSNGLKFGMLMYLDHFKNWLDFVHDLSIFFILASLWPSETGQILGFQALSWEPWEE